MTSQTGIAGRTVIVTGGSSGIGLATARAFAAGGAHVAIVSRDPAKLARAKTAVEGARAHPDQKVIAASADLSDWDVCRATADSLLADDVVPDVLVNSAGVIVPGEFLTMSPDDFDRNLVHGFDSVVNPCRAFAPTMVRRRSGHIVNVSSVAGFLGIYGYTSYAAAKYAVMGFTEALRFELRPEGVRVSVVCPPDTDTPALDYEKTLRPAETERIAGNIKAIPPERVAEAIVHGVRHGRYFIIPGASSRFYFRLKGLAPELFFAIVDRDVTKARKHRRREA